jgi:hypothetical protein
MQSAPVFFLCLTSILYFSFYHFYHYFSFNKIVSLVTKNLFCIFIIFRCHLNAFWKGQQVGFYRICFLLFFIFFPQVQPSQLLYLISVINQGCTTKFCAYILKPHNVLHKWPNFFVIPDLMWDVKPKGWIAISELYIGRGFSAHWRCLISQLKKNISDYTVFTYI